MPAEPHRILTCISMELLEKQAHWNLLALMHLGGTTKYRYFGSFVTLGAAYGTTVQGHQGPGEEGSRRSGVQGIRVQGRGVQGMRGPKDQGPGDRGSR